MGVGNNETDTTTSIWGPKEMKPRASLASLGHTLFYKRGKVSGNFQHHTVQDQTCMVQCSLLLVALF